MTSPWHLIPHRVYGDVTILRSVIRGADWDAIKAACDDEKPVQFLCVNVTCDEMIIALTERGLKLTEPQRAEVLAIFRQVVPERRMEIMQMELF